MCDLLPEPIEIPPDGALDLEIELDGSEPVLSGQCGAFSGARVFTFDLPRPMIISLEVLEVEGNLRLALTGDCPSADVPRLCNEQALGSRVGIHTLSRLDGLMPAGPVGIVGYGGPQATGRVRVRVLPVECDGDCAAWQWLSVQPDRLCATDGLGRMTCWSRDQGGHAIETLLLRRPFPVPASLGNACGQRPDGSVICWNEGLGLRFADPLGDTPRAGYRTFSANGRTVAGGLAARCLIDREGALRCTGDDELGRTPRRRDGAFADVVVGTCQTCALRTDGRIECFGSRPHELQPALDQTARCRNDVVMHDPPDGRFTRLTGHTHTFAALSVTGRIVHWSDSGSAPSADPPDRAYVEVARDLRRTCGMRPDGTVECWGAPGQAIEVLPGRHRRVFGGEGERICTIGLDDGISCFPAFGPNIRLECAADDQCAEGHACVDALCRAPDDCGACLDGSICHRGACLAIDAIARTCAVDSACAPGDRCVDGHCAAWARCDGEGDCVAGQRCDSGACVFQPPCEDSSTCLRPAICAQGLCVPPPACERAAECPEQRECRDGICQRPVPCDGDVDCPQGRVCLQGTCAEPPACSAHGHCHAPAICSDGECSERACADGCPADSQCGFGGGLCNATRDCRGDLDCRPSHACDGRFCRVRPECFEDADCPADQACVDTACIVAECRGDRPCEPGFACVDARCRFSPGAAGTCAAPTVLALDDGYATHHGAVDPAGASQQAGRCVADSGSEWVYRFDGEPRVHCARLVGGPPGPGPAIAVRGGALACGEPASERGCTRDGRSGVTFVASAQGTHHIIVDAHEENGGRYQLEIVDEACDPEGTCDAPYAIGLGDEVFGETRGRIDLHNLCGFDNGPQVFYRFVDPDGGPVCVMTRDSSTFMDVEIRTAACEGPDARILSCTELSGDVEFEAEPGRAYFIGLEGEHRDDGGYRLRVMRGPCPDDACQRNNDCPLGDICDLDTCTWSGACIFDAHCPDDERCAPALRRCL